jgi:hypothetical protein
MSNRFDYVKYDVLATNIQAAFKAKMMDLEEMADTMLPKGRHHALVMTKLEECYMWIGKAIRDDQIVRTGSAPLQEERNNG